MIQRRELYSHCLHDPTNPLVQLIYIIHFDQTNHQVFSFTYRVILISQITMQWTQLSRMIFSSSTKITNPTYAPAYEGSFVENTSKFIITIHRINILQIKNTDERFRLTAILQRVKNQTRLRITVQFKTCVRVLYQQFIYTVNNNYKFEVFSIEVFIKCRNYSDRRIEDVLSFPGPCHQPSSLFSL